MVEKITFNRATILYKDQETEFYVTISAKSGIFEIFESGEIVASGLIHGYENLKEKIDTPTFDEKNLVLKKSDIYKELSLRNCKYHDIYQGILECDYSGLNGRLEWKEEITSFLECMIQLSLCQYVNLRGIMLQTYLERISIDPFTFFKAISESKGEFTLTRYRLKIC